MIALCMIRQQPHYRRHAFETGLRRAGYSMIQGGRPAGPEDLLVIWNRYGACESMARTWEQIGGTVLVCENGYLGVDSEQRQYYAISAHGHNGSGWFPRSGEDRFAKLGIDVEPWRPGGDHILVRGQRGIGTAQMASPVNWHNEAGSALRKLTTLPVRIVDHPGNVSPKPIPEALDRAGACVIWSSALGVLALVRGIPVFYGAPYWICSGAARPLSEYALGPVRDDRARNAELCRMADGQWSVQEIESGAPFAAFRDYIRSANAGGYSPDREVA
jgi:hypothetical protein